MTARKKAAAKKTASQKKTAKTLRAGDHVSWTTSQGETHGVVVKKLTSATDIKTHHVAASPDNPEYLVRSDKSDELAAHKPASLRRSAARSTTRATTKKKAAKSPAKKAAT